MNLPFNNDIENDPKNNHELCSKPGRSKYFNKKLKIGAYFFTIKPLIIIDFSGLGTQEKS